MAVNALLMIFLVMGNVVNSALSAWIFYNIFVADGIALIETNETIAIIELILSAALLFINIGIALLVMFKRE